MTTKEAAAYLGYSQDSLEWWRRTGKGPLFHRGNNGKISYLEKDLFEWLVAKRKQAAINHVNK